MALAIGVSRGSKIDVGGHVIEVKELTSPNLIVISVDNQPDIVISEMENKPILPDVLVQVGVSKGGAYNRLAFTAPMSIRISRIEDGKK